MAKYVIDGKTLTDIAESIRQKKGTTADITPENMPSEIAGITGGGEAEEEWFNDGNTHIWITLQEGRKSPAMGMGVNGNVTIDWGDGTTPTVLTGANIRTIVWTEPHEYAEAGDYIITLTVNGQIQFMGSSATRNGAYILQPNSTFKPEPQSYYYRHALRKIEVGNNATVGAYAFYVCNNLSSIVIPNGMTNLDSGTFNSCNHLTSIDIPDTVTNIGNTAFANCYNISHFVIPPSVKSIVGQAFLSCCARYYDFTNHTTIPTLSSATAFSGISEDCEIRVPVALYDEWIAATNWSGYANNILAV